MKTNSEIRKAGLNIREMDAFGGMATAEVGGQKCSIVWGRDEGGKEHVSMSGRDHTPTWDDMCWLKDTFWNDNEECYQLHPKKSEYINLAKKCLHIWRDIKC